MRKNEEIWCQNLLYSTPSRKIEGSSRSRMDKQKMKTCYKFCKSLQSRQIQRQQQITNGKGVVDKYFDQILHILQNYTKSTNSKAALDHGWRGCFCVLPCITNIDHSPPETSSISHDQAVDENWDEHPPTSENK